MMASKSQPKLNELHAGDQEGQAGQLRDIRLPPGSRAPAGLKDEHAYELGSTAREINQQRVVNATGMQPGSEEGAAKQLVPPSLAQMQRTQNSLASARQPQNLLDTNRGIFSLRGDVHLFDPSTSKNQTQQRTMYAHAPIKMGSLGNISSANLSEAERPAGVQQEPGSGPGQAVADLVGAQRTAEPGLPPLVGIPAKQIREHALSAVTPDDKDNDVEVNFSADQKKENATFDQLRTAEMLGPLQKNFGPRFTHITLEISPRSLPGGTAPESLASGKGSQQFDSAQKVDGKSLAQDDAQLQQVGLRRAQRIRDVGTAGDAGARRPRPESSETDTAERKAAIDKKQALEREKRGQQAELVADVDGPDRTESLHTDTEWEYGEYGPEADETSCGTLGVHDVIYSEKHWGKKMIPRTGAYEVLKVDGGGLVSLYERAMKSYNHEEEHFKEFIRFCQTTCHHESPINPYPIMHQMYQGRFVVKNQSYQPDCWPTLVEKALRLADSDELRVGTSIFYLEECHIEDEVLGNVIKALSLGPQLREIYLVGMRVGPQAAAALKQLATARGLKADRPGLSICLRRCEVRYTDFEDQYPELLSRDFPLIHSQLSQLTSLTLSNQRLVDGHLDLLLKRLT